MKKAVIWLLFVLTILFPAGTVITACFGYTFKLISVSAFAVTIAALSVYAVFVVKNVSENKTIQVLLAMITPLSLINAVFYILESPQIWVIASALISVGCCCCLTVKYGKPVSLKIVTLVLFALMILPIGFISFIALIFGNIGLNTVVQAVESPSGKYYAQVIDSDQGALGGDTRVDVYQKSGINVVLFRIEKKPQRVYMGDWGEYKTMRIYWKGEGCLVINAVEYEIE